jgi:hypothetical protein
MADSTPFDSDAARHPDSYYSPDDIQQEPIDVSQLLFRNYEPVGTPLLDDVNLAVVLENSYNTQESQEERHEISQVTDSQLTEPLCSQQAAAKKSWVRFSYSGKKFKAYSALYLNPTFEGSFRAKFPADLHLTGRIRGCPSKNNHNVFDIVWDLKGTVGLDKTWLLSKLEGTPELKGTLKEAILEYVEPTKDSRKRATVEVAMASSRPTSVTDVAHNSQCSCPSRRTTTTAERTYVVIWTKRNTTTGNKSCALLSLEDILIKIYEFPKLCFGFCRRIW